MIKKIIITEKENEAFQKISDLILDCTGIYITPNKFQILKIKLNKILHDWQVNSYEELYEILKEDKYGPKFFDIINEISVNVTEFNRQQDHFLFLKKIAAQEFFSRTFPGEKIRSWSAASSTGQEAYDIAMILADSLEDYEKENNKKLDCKIEVMASDISHRALDIARKGIYSREDLFKAYEKEFIHRHFQNGTGSHNGHVKIKDYIHNLVDFQHINLYDTLTFQEEFDCVFLRNVLIYFNEETQKKIINKICNTIKKDGYLFLGYSELIYDTDYPLKYIKPSIYKKK